VGTTINKLIKKLYDNQLVGRVFHTSVYCLKKELEKNCSSVLDLGCGADSPVGKCKIQYSVGVDGFLASIKSSKQKRVHSDYVFSNINFLNFQPDSFDAVVLIEVLEHLPREDGDLLIKKAEDWAKKKVIITTPNGFFPQADMDGNQYFRHISGWSIQEMMNRGYKARGLAGLKSLRRGSESVSDHGLMSTIRFRPKVFWIIVSELFQVVTYYFPSASFEVFYVKKLEEKA
jgi:hypothetical protein